MITQSMTTQVLNHTILAPAQVEQWNMAGYPFNSGSAAEAWLTGFAMIALIISVVLVFWVTIKHKRLEDHLNTEIAALKADNELLRKELSKHTHEPSKVPEQIIPEESEEPVITR